MFNSIDGAIMKKIMLFLSILILIIPLNNCTGPEGPAGPPGKDATMEKQIRLTFELTTWGVPYDSVYTILSCCSIPKFNITNYLDVDSVVFFAYISAEGENNYCIVDLFNLTDSIAIKNSLLKTNLDGEYVETGNIYNNLPKKEIDLAIRIRSSYYNTESHVNIGHAYLFLYRR